jgi:hypothetical protein
MITRTVRVATMDKQNQVVDISIVEIPIKPSDDTPQSKRKFNKQRITCFENLLVTLDQTGHIRIIDEV